VTLKAVLCASPTGPHSQRHITPNATEEVKLDGYRALALKSRTGLTLFSRRKKSFNRQFAHIVDALADLPEGTVVDGELVAIDDSGRPDFSLLQNFLSQASRMWSAFTSITACL